MLTFQIMGPDQAGQFTIVYETPGNLQRTLHTGGLSSRSAVEECHRLNEGQVVERRRTLRETANALAEDL